MGITHLNAFTSLIGINYAGNPFYILIIIGFISPIDRILISLILPKWTPAITSLRLISHGQVDHNGHKEPNNKGFPMGHFIGGTR